MVSRIAHQLYFIIFSVIVLAYYVQNPPHQATHMHADTYMYVMIIIILYI